MPTASTLMSGPGVIALSMAALIVLIPFLLALRDGAIVPAIALVVALSPLAGWMYGRLHGVLSASVTSAQAASDRDTGDAGAARRIRVLDSHLPVAVDPRLEGRLLGVAPWQFEVAVRTAVDRWNAAAGRELLTTRAHGLPLRADRSCSKKSVATAWTRYDGAALIPVRICFNRAVRFSAHGDASGYDIVAILLHELGHGLGLHHPESPDGTCHRPPRSVMCANPVGFQPTRPQPADIQRIRALYHAG